MIIRILGNSIRKDDSIMRFLVEFPELETTGYHGIQIGLPAIIEDIMDTVRKCYVKVNQQIIDVNILKMEYADFLDKEIILSDAG